MHLGAGVYYNTNNKFFLNNQTFRTSSDEPTSLVGVRRLLILCGKNDNKYDLTLVSEIVPEQGNRVHRETFVQALISFKLR